MYITHTRMAIAALVLIAFALSACQNSNTPPALNETESLTAGIPAIEDGTQLWSGGNYALALSPDGNLVAYSDVDVNGINVIVLRSFEDRQLVQTLMGHTGLIWKLFFSADGSLLVSIGNEILIWQTSSGKLLSKFVVNCP